MSRPWATGIKDPIRDVLRVLCGGKEPPDFVRGYDYSHFTDAQHSELQDWVGMNLADGISWSTAIGVIDAAEAITEEAVGNANISAEWERENPTPAKPAPVDAKKRSPSRAPRRTPRTRP